MVTSPFNVSQNDTKCPPHDDTISETDWLDDAELSPKQRAQCNDVAVSRVGHAQRRCWPADEVQGALQDDRE
jgi:hypothetical protein